MTSEEGGDATCWILFDRIEIDLTGRRLFVDGEKAALEPKAFAVLALFAQQPGRAFARDEILDAIWGHRHVTPGVLNRIITLLRHALGESAEHTQYIHTLHGVGYRFDAPVRFSTGRAVAEPIDAAPAPTATSAPEIVDAAEPARALAPQPSRTSPHRLARALFALSAISMLAVAGLVLWQRAASVDVAPVSVKHQGIAVLPLVNATGDASRRFFADGISENLINTLSQYEGLKVIGRGSSFRFRDSKEGAMAIGAKLGVAHLIEGSVQRDGNDVRIGIELIRAADGTTVWTRTFDRPHMELFALQDEIALAVAGALQVKLLHAMPGAVDTGRPSTGNLDAYSAYLRGTYYMSADDIQRAIEQFSQATQIDPAYAQAWSWLGFMRTQYTRGQLSGDAARISYTQAREEIDTALRLQPNFGQAHAIRANWLGAANHDWNGALEEFRIALALVPETDPTHGAISRLLATLGRINEAIAERHKYIDGDPLGAFARVYLADLQASLGRLDQADASLREAEELHPAAADWHAGMRSKFAILRGNADAALAAAASMSSGYWRDFALALALQIGNDRKGADAALQHLIESSEQANRDPYDIARVYALRADADKTFDWLQRDWERGATAVHYVLLDPLLLRFRDDPRFAAYCKQAGLPPPSASEALSIDGIRAALAARR